MKAGRAKWWLLIPGVVVGAGLAISLWRGHAPARGAIILEKLEASAGPRRGALIVLDYAPNRADVTRLGAQKLDRGDGPLPGMGLAQGDPGQHWMRGTLDDTAIEFVWHTEETLRAALAENQPAWRAIERALADAGYGAPAIQQILKAAAAELDAMTDEELFLAWLRADRAAMAEREDAIPAAREGLLLMARENTGPAVMFVLEKERIYLLPLDAAPGTAPEGVWVRMEAYQEGRLKWAGVLRLAPATPPDKVRLLAACLAAETTPP